MIMKIGWKSRFLVIENCEKILSTEVAFRDTPLRLTLISKHTKFKTLPSPLYYGGAGNHYLISGTGNACAWHNNVMSCP